MSNQAQLDAKTIIIPAGTAANPGRITLALPGEQFFCWSASAKFQLQFDNQPVCTMAGGFKTAIAWTMLNFLNPNNYAITVTFFYGANSVTFNGLIQSQDLTTYLLGNLGLSASGVYNGQNVTIGAGVQAGYIKMDIATPNLRVSGVNNGNNRRTIIFSCAQASDGPPALNKGVLIVNDVNGNNFLRVGAGQAIAFDTPSDVILNVNADNTYFNIGEIYYQS